MSKHSVLLEGLKRSGECIYLRGTKETPGIARRLNVLGGTKEAETVFPVINSTVAAGG